jgi:hypothetical protein
MSPALPPDDAGTTPTVTPADDYWNTPLASGEEPVVTGTLFFVIIILMIIAAVWVIMYLRLLDR